MPELKAERRHTHTIWVRTPFGRPNVRMAVAAARAGAFPVLDVAGMARPATNDTVAELVAAFAGRTDGGLGLALGAEAAELDLATLPVEIDAVIAPWELLSRGAAFSGLTDRSPRRLIAEVVGLDEAIAAVEALGPWLDGILAKGAESGGRVHHTGAFVLLQQVLDELARRDAAIPVWLQGGIGLHTAPAAIVGGAAGVVLDSQLALTREGDLPLDLSRAIAAMDGSETTVVDGVRIFTRPGAPLLDGEPVPTGQDTAFAAPLAERFRTTGGVVQAVAAAIEREPVAAARLEPLAPGSALATAHGLRHPVAQGPMTRVSDRAAFARSVADGGGLPFLALALMRGDEVRELLTETKALLADRPWGVGILGFVPPELREEQLAVVHDLAPPVALIAGGRPSQAAPLDAAGIATFLHVPSPGLLDRFLKDGARRFVFEGRECGGHVGPRPSFALWEIQVQRLLAFAAAGGTDGKGSLTGIEALFAGGVHDQRSAAMVGTLAAPIVARGAAVGVLMGTAYLFTEEAVAGGAILPAFQDAAVECERTVLLETSPGHATRCVDSPYVQAFEEARARLEADGATVQEMWAELEQLNLGRLRIASKGLRREEAGTVEVDEATQRAEGMYMIGDVATMRRERTTVAALHDEVSSGATEWIAHFGAPADDATVEARPIDIAIVGMACVFPGASSPEEFWSNVVGGVDSVTEVPAERWDVDLYYDENAFTEGAGTKTPSKWGGFLPDIPFDALAYGIPPRSLAAIETVQLLSLEVAQRALADAGYAGREFDRDRVSVIFGAEAGTDLSSTYGFRSLLPAFSGGPVEGSLDDFLPKLTEDSFPGLLTNVIAGRIANRLDLGGVNYTVDAACAASLAALDLSCKELVDGTSDMVLCGGADLHNGINDYLLFASVHALSPTGRCQTFDADADGIALGEGVACVVLKRLADAERDGDRIYAVVKGIAGSSDGRHLGLTAPRKEGQRRALDRAYARAGVDPASVGLVEAHGTGTAVGDKTELLTLTEMFRDAGAAPRSATVGSVKSNIGHTKCAAGLAGIIKAANAVYRGVRPPTLHVRTPNPGYDADQSPFRLETTPVPWLDDERVAGVSAFGFGGTNFHAVLARYDGDDAPRHGLEQWPAELFLFRGADRDAARAAIERLSDWLDQAHQDRASVALRDLAATVSTSGTGPVQVAVVAATVADLRAKLPSAGAFTAEKGGVFVAAEDPDARPGAAAGSVAFVFPGQGSQRPGMLADLYVAFPWLQEHLRTGADWFDVLFPPSAFTRADADAQKAAVTDTRVAQPVLGIAGMTMADLLGALGIRPHATAGHSYGELVALAAAGAIGEADLLAVSRARGEAIVAAAGDDPGTMAAASADPAAVDEILAATPAAAGVVVANRNSPTQSVISGPTLAVEAAVAALAGAGIAAKKIPVACAFHSAVVAGASPELRRTLDAVEIDVPSVPVWSNTLAARHESDPDAIRALLARQVAEPVRWVEQVEAMYEAGVRVFVECGPGRVLTQLVGKILGDRPHTVVATDAGGDHGVTRVLQAVAELATSGIDVDPTVLFHGRTTEVDLRNPAPAGPGWILNGHLVRTKDRAIVPGGLRPFDEVPVGALGGPAGVRTPEKDGAVVEYLRGMRELVATQRDVMLRYLGGPVPDGVTLPIVGGGVLDATSSLAAAPMTSVAATAAASPEAATPDAVAATVVHTPEQLRSAVLSIVSDRTGYPLDMLDPDLDLEADLSIDSIKRIEILGELADRVGLPGADGDSVDESVVEELAQIKTINGIVGWILEHRDAEGAATGAAPSGSTGSEPSAPPPIAGAPAHDPDGSNDGAAVPVPERTLRFAVRLAEAPAPVAEPATMLAGRRFVVIDDERGAALDLADLLEERGASVRIAPAGSVLPLEDQHEPLDGLIDLEAMAPGSGTTARDAFERVKEVAIGGARWIVGVSAAGGRFGFDGGASPDDGEAGPPLFPSGAGLPGMLRTVAREFPEARVRAIDVDAKAGPKAVARWIADELLLDGHVVVGRTSDGRFGLDVVEEPLPGTGAGGGASRLPDSAGVAVLTGGARGITAELARGLAAETGCAVVLLGRTPMPDADEPDDVAGAVDAAALRKVLIDGGARKPAEIEAAVSRILAEREMRATMAALAELGVDARYDAVDVRDPDAVAAALGRVREQHGRLDLVVHGAGVLEDKFVRDKTAESFARVFDTKVVGAGALVGQVPADTTVVVFGSIAGVFGNRGQVDYSAANDALDQLARTAAGAPGPHIVAADWGPWAGGGMVSPELEREYERRGIGLVGQDEGVALLLAELRAGAPEPQVVFMRAWPEALAGPTG